MQDDETNARHIDELLKENSANYYKLLTIVGIDLEKEKKITEYLRDSGWKVYDVEDIVMELIENIPPEKVRIRIGKLIKDWTRTVEGKMVLTNADILYSPEMAKIGPLQAFKYSMREDKREGVLFLHARLKGNMAIYSEPDKDDYSEQELNEVLYVNIRDVIVE